MPRRGKQMHIPIPKQCSRGHKLTGDNLLRPKWRRWACRLCHNLSNRQWRKRRKWGLIPEHDWVHWATKVRQHVERVEGLLTDSV